MGAMAIMTACGQPNPTATSSDDTHSVAKGSQDTSDQSGSGGGIANNPSSPSTTTVNGTVQPTPTMVPVCEVMPLANCQNVDLRGLDLFYANMSGANLRGMDLTGADFTGANLIGATLDYAFFFETNLTGAKLTRVSIEGIVWDDTTIWPTGFVPPDY